MSNRFSKFEQRFIRAFWETKFKTSICEYCGKSGVDKIYKDYACHTKCEKKVNGSFRYHFRFTYKFRELNWFKRTYIIIKDIINISFINLRGMYYEQLRKTKAARRSKR